MCWWDRNLRARLVANVAIGAISFGNNRPASCIRSGLVLGLDVGPSLSVLVVLEFGGCDVAGLAVWAPSVEPFKPATGDQVAVPTLRHGPAGGSARRPRRTLGRKALSLLSVPNSIGRRFEPNGKRGPNPTEQTQFRAIPLCVKAVYLLANA